MKHSLERVRLGASRAGCYALSFRAGAMLFLTFARTIAIALLEPSSLLPTEAGSGTSRHWQDGRWKFRASSQCTRAARKLSFMTRTRFALFRRLWGGASSAVFGESKGPRRDSSPHWESAGYKFAGTSCAFLDAILAVQDWHCFGCLSFGAPLQITRSSFHQRRGLRTFSTTLKQAGQARSLHLLRLKL